MSKHAYLIALILEIILVLWLNFLWEQASYFRLLTESLNHAIGPLVHFAATMTLRPYPFLFAWIASRIMLLTGPGQWPYFLTQAIFLIIYVLSVFFAAKITFNAKTGFLAASFLLYSAQAVTALRTFYIDYDLAALVMLQLTCYLYSGKLTKPIPSLLFGALVSLGLWGKFSYLVYFPPILIAIAYDLWRNSEPRSLAFFTNRSTLPLLVITPLLAWFISGQAKCESVMVLYWTSLAAFGSAFIAYRTGERSSLLRLWAIVTCFVSLSVFFQFFQAHIEEAEFTRNIVTYAQNNVDLDTEILPATSLHDKLMLVGMWTQAYLINLKTKVLLPIWFWHVVIGVTLCVASPVLRRRTGVILIPLILTSVFVAYATCNDTRYYSPLLGMYAIVATFWLVPSAPLKNAQSTENDRLKWPRNLWRWCAPVISWVAFAAITIIGLAMSGGWLTQLPMDVVPTERLHRDLGYTHLWGPGPIFEYKVIVDPSKPGVAHYSFFRANTFDNLVNKKSAYSDALLFTVPPEDKNWQECYTNILRRIPAGGKLYVVTDPEATQVEVTGNSGEICTALRFAHAHDHATKMMAQSETVKAKNAKRLLYSDPNVCPDRPSPSDLASKKTLVLYCALPEYHPEEFGKLIYSWKSDKICFYLYQAGTKEAGAKEAGAKA